MARAGGLSARTMEKVVVIGASGGIGAALAEALDGEGVGVIRFARNAMGAMPIDLTDEASIAAAAVSTLLGLPLAWLLARHDGRITGLVRAAVLVPMVLPPVVGGTALLFALGRRGLVGQWLDTWFGVTLPFTTAGAVIAATFVALPFFVTTVEAALRQAGPDLEEAAAVAGASPLTRLLTVTIPASRDAILAGVALAWARALGEFGATITFAGNLAGETRTLPLEIFLALESDPAAAVAVSVLLLGVSLAVLVALRGRWFRR